MFCTNGGAESTAAGRAAPAGESFVFAVYPGGHGQSLWSEHAPHWVSLALGHLEAPSPS